MIWCTQSGQTGRVSCSMLPRSTNTLRRELKLTDRQTYTIGWRSTRRTSPCIPKGHCTSYSVSGPIILKYRIFSFHMTVKPMTTDFITCDPFYTSEQYTLWFMWSLHYSLFFFLGPQILRPRSSPICNLKVFFIFFQSPLNAHWPHVWFRIIIRNWFCHSMPVAVEEPFGVWFQRAFNLLTELKTKALYFMKWTT